MIEYLSSLIVDLLEKNKVIKNENVSIYQYGFEIFISSLITVIIALLWGVILNCIFEAALYFVLFVILRTVCGGYHAKTYWQCNFIFFITTLFVLLLYRFVPLKMFNELHICSIIFSIVTTIYYAPVENENKPLSLEQKNFYRILSTAIVITLVIISCVLKIKFNSDYSILIDATLFIVAFSMFVTEPMKGGE